MKIWTWTSFFLLFYRYNNIWTSLLVNWLFADPTILNRDHRYTYIYIGHQIIRPWSYEKQLTVAKKKWLNIFCWWVLVHNRYNISCIPVLSVSCNISILRYLAWKSGQSRSGRWFSMLARSRNHTKFQYTIGCDSTKPESAKHASPSLPTKRIMLTK